MNDFFSAASAGIDRVVFDHAPAWTRDDLMLRALEAPPAYAHLVAGNETVFWGSSSSRCLTVRPRRSRPTGTIPCNGAVLGDFPSIVPMLIYGESS